MFGRKCASFVIQNSSFSTLSRSASLGVWNNAHRLRVEFQWKHLCHSVERNTLLKVAKIFRIMSQWCFSVRESVLENNHSIYKKYKSGSGSNRSMSEEDCARQKLAHLLAPVSRLAGSGQPRPVQWLLSGRELNCYTKYSDEDSERQRARHGQGWGMSSPVLQNQKKENAGKNLRDLGERRKLIKTYKPHQRDSEEKKKSWFWKHVQCLSFPGQILRTCSQL